MDTIFIVTLVIVGVASTIAGIYLYSNFVAPNLGKAASAGAAFTPSVI
jgi:hypothetical protein